MSRPLLDTVARATVTAASKMTVEHCDRKIETVIKTCSMVEAIALLFELVEKTRLVPYGSFAIM